MTDLPTRLDPALSLASTLACDDVWIKRDDLSASPYGGNKVRKLDFLLADALDRGCDSVVTFGAAGSNHVLATAIYARQRGLTCYGILTDQPITPYVAQTLRYHHFLGTTLIHAEGYGHSIRLAEQIAADHPQGADRVYNIPWGGSSWLGTVAFVDAALELAGQFPESSPPENVYVACGTMGTAVGLALGFRLAGLPARVIAIQVVPDPVTTQDNLQRLFERTNLELHDREGLIPIFEDPLEGIELRGEFLGTGYARPTTGCLEAVRMIEASEGLKLETTYTGKALAALIDDARAGRHAAGPTVFWNTYNSRPYPAELPNVSADAFPDALRHYFDEC
jgi:D-cysteine desulfhydrase